MVSVAFGCATEPDVAAGLLSISVLKLASMTWAEPPGYGRVVL
jgi:hypothetical protein